MKFAASPVGFVHGAPNEHTSMYAKASPHLARKALIGGNIHIRDVHGCSHVQSPPAKLCALHSLTATSANAFPRVTFSLRIADRTGSPQGNSTERIIVATHPLQAIEKLEQGGPT